MNYIRIRGMGSINAGNDPLIVIDGTPVNSGNLSGFNDCLLYTSLQVLVGYTNDTHTIATIVVLTILI